MRSNGREELADDPRPELARTALFVVWVVATGLELCCWWAKFTTWWMAVATIVHSIWGWLDAILRFPKLHDVESLFTLKHVCLMLLKMLLLAFGMTNLQKNALYFLGLLFLNMMLPVIYLLMLPLDDEAVYQRIYSHGVVDEDIAIRMFRVLANPTQNWFKCKRQAEAAFFGLMSKSPKATEVARGLSPKSKRMLSRERLNI